MSILIKGMKMPESCFCCQFRRKVNPEEIMCLATGEIFEETFVATIKMRNAKGKCPLVEIPEPHGNLIDRDALGVEEYEREDDDTGTLEISIGGLLDLYHKIKDAPTIIEVERKENT